MRVARLNEAQRGVLLTSMSDASCAMTLGRSLAWVVRMRRELAEACSGAIARLAEPRCLSASSGANALEAVGRVSSEDCAPDKAPTPPAMATNVAPTPKPEARSPKPGSASRPVEGQPAVGNGGMTGEGVTDWSLPDADVIARAVGASCVVRKLEPELAWRSAGRTVRILAGAALKARQALTDAGIELGAGRYFPVDPDGLFLQLGAAPGAGSSCTASRSRAGTKNPCPSSSVSHG